MGADIYIWEKAYGHGSWDGKPYDERARELVGTWLLEWDETGDPMLERCLRQLAEAMGMKGIIDAVNARIEASNE